MNIDLPQEQSVSENGTNVKFDVFLKFSMLNLVIFHVVFELLAARFSFSAGLATARPLATGGLFPEERPPPSPTSRFCPASFTCPGWLSLRPPYQGRLLAVLGKVDGGGGRQGGEVRRRHQPEPPCG